MVRQSPSVRLTPSLALLSVPLSRLEQELGSVFNHLHPKTSPGLSEVEAAKRLAVQGRNALTPPKEVPEIIKYLKMYMDPFLLLLVRTRARQGEASRGRS